LREPAELGNDNKSFPSIDPATNRFNAHQGYGYDKNGNLIANADGLSVVFNGENKQSEVLDQNNHPIGRYVYDGEGRRVKKVTDLETTVFVYDASSKLIAEYSNRTPENPNTSYVATDTLLSVRLVTDKNGNVVSRRDFKPFGEDLAADGSARKTADKYSNATEDKVRQRFTGYQKDIETGLDFAEARMYENRHGRFTAVDPLLASGKSANPQTFNRYTYVMNSPLVNTDPTGLQTNQETENEPGTIDGGTTRACEFFNFACRAMKWVTSTISWNGESSRTGSWELAAQAVTYRSYALGGDDTWETDSNPTPIRFGFQQVVNSTTKDQFDALNRTMEEVDAKIQWVPILSSIYNVQKSGHLAEQGRGSYGRFAFDFVLLGADVVTAPTGSKGQAAKSIALGLETIGERFVLKELAETTTSSIAKNWASDGITRRTVTNNFGRAFNQAASRADQIYFALDGLIDDIPGALDKGRRFGFDVPRRNVTNAELYTIVNNPSLLQKTTFFVNNRRVVSPF